MSVIHQDVFQPDLIANALRRYGVRTLVQLHDGTGFTGDDIAAAASRFAQALGEAGVSKGCRVGILSGNRIEVLHVAIATMFIEAVLVPLHPFGSVDDFAFVARDASLDVIIFDPSFEQQMLALQGKDGIGARFFSLGDSAACKDLLATVPQFEAGPLSPPTLTGDEVFRLAYSGGTTGQPKAIEITHRMMQALTYIQLAEWEWPGQIRQLLCAPLSHAGAAVFLPTLLRGGTLFIEPGFNAETVMRSIETYRINCILLVPTMIYALLDHPRFAEFDLSSLETIFYGASAISPVRLKEGIEKLGQVFFQFYGQSEAPVSVTVLRRNEHDIENMGRLASCGRPVPWVHVALLDVEGTQVGDGEPGEIAVRGPLVTPGYFNRPDLTAEVFADGWLRTGDIAVRDADGFLTIVGRAKDMIITGGFNVYAREVEDALASHPAVAANAVFGIPDQRWGELVCAAVVLRGGMAPTSEELREHVRNLKGSHQAPKRIEFIDQIPLTALAKPDKKALQRRYGQF